MDTFIRMIKKPQLNSHVTVYESRSDSRSGRLYFSPEAKFGGTSSAWDISEMKQKLGTDVSNLIPSEVPLATCLLPSSNLAREPSRPFTPGMETADNEVFAPIKTDLSAAPSQLLKIIKCSCRIDGCDSEKCTCKKNGLECTIACRT
ncbi:hypothetical protein QYM36_018500, partial [Artemia franciscana]